MPRDEDDGDASPSLRRKVARLERQLQDVWEMYRNSQAVVAKYECILNLNDNDDNNDEEEEEEAPSETNGAPPPSVDVVECSLVYRHDGQEDDEDEDDDDEDERDQIVSMDLLRPRIKPATPARDDDFIPSPAVAAAAHPRRLFPVISPSDFTSSSPAATTTTATLPPTQHHQPTLDIEAVPQEEEEEEAESQDLLLIAPPTKHAPAPPPPAPPAPVAAPHQPKYSEVVRGKAAREALPGHACAECQAFYQSIQHTLHPGEDLQTVMNRYSRHRHQHKPPSTPPGYWDVWSLRADDEDEEAQDDRGKKRARIAAAAPI